MPNLLDMHARNFSDFGQRPSNSALYDVQLDMADSLDEYNAVAFGGGGGGDGLVEGDDACSGGDGGDDGPSCLGWDRAPENGVLISLN
jgi:hypothetical protein